MTLRVAIAYSFNDRDWLGGKNYFASLFKALEKMAPRDIQMVLVIGKKTITSLPDEFPWLEVLRTPLMDRLHPLWLVRQATLRGLDSDPLLASFLRRHRIDLLSHSGYLGPRPGLKTLAWLFDFQFMHLPEHWSESQLRWVRRRYAAACRQCDGIIVSSGDALNDLQRFMPHSTATKHVLRFVSNPVNFERIPPKQDILQRYQLPPNYLYLPNQFWSHKNHGVVIDALALLQAQGVKATVACTGLTADLRHPEYFPSLMEKCRASGIEDSFRVLGLVPFADTQALMMHATAVINPSRFEGWSTTVEEAKTLQKPLLLSNLQVHQEQSPELGRFFSPDDPQALAELIKNVLAAEPHQVQPAQVTENYNARQQEFASSYVSILRATMQGFVAPQS